MTEQVFDRPGMDRGALGRGFSPWLRRLPGRRASRRESMAVVRLTAACESVDTDSARMLDAWAGHERPAQARRLARFATVLGASRRFEAAIEAEPDCLQDLDRSALRFAERSRLMQSVLERRIEAWETRRPSGRLRQVAGYTLFVAMHFLVIAGFIGWTILPRYERIFTEYGMDTDSSMLMAKTLSNAVAIAGPLVVVGLFASALLAVAPRLRRAIAPWSGRFERKALVLDLFAVAAEAGRPPADTARVVAECLEDRRLSRRLTAALEACPRGARSDLLVRAGCMSRREGSFLEAAERLGGASFALRTIARHRRDARGRFDERLEESLVPLAAVVMGGLVLVEASAILSPLVRLARGLS